VRRVTGSDHVRVGVNDEREAEISDSRGSRDGKVVGRQEANTCAQIA
jgi:hypothetical protein